MTAPKILRLPDSALGQDRITLRGNQCLTNDGLRFCAYHPLIIHGDPANPPDFGMILHRPLVTNPSGKPVHHSLHGCSLHNVVFTGKFKKGACTLAGPELVTISNINVDAAECGLFQFAIMTVDYFKTGLPFGPTASAIKILSLHLNGYSPTALLLAGEVTDVEIDFLTVAGRTRQVIRSHHTGEYPWFEWSKAEPNTSEGRPKGVIVRRFYSEGTHEYGRLFSFEKLADRQAAKPFEIDGVTIAQSLPDKFFVLGQVDKDAHWPLLDAAPTEAPGDPQEPPDNPKDPPAEPTDGTDYDLQPSIPAPWFGKKLPSVTGSATIRVNGSENPNGIPLNPPAGSIIDLSGQFTSAGMNYFWINGARGEPGRPIIYRASGAMRSNSKIFLDRCKDLVFVGIEAHKFEIGPGCERILFIESEAKGIKKAGEVGFVPGGGISIGGTAALPVRDIAIVGGASAYNGNWLTSADQDIHGVTVAGHSSLVHLLNMVFTENSGNGVQINAGGLSNEKTTHHIYVSGCSGYRNKQAVLHAKQSAAVVFEGNVLEDCEPRGDSPSDWGATNGGQYGPDFLVSANNFLEAACWGFSSESTSGGGTGDYHMVIGNVIRRIGPSARWIGQYNPNTAWSNAAIKMVGANHKCIALNTIDEACAGINLPGGKFLTIQGNVISLYTDGGRFIPGNHLYLEDPAIDPSSYIGDNVFCSTDTARIPNAKIRRANQMETRPLDLWPLTAEYEPMLGTRRFTPHANLIAYLRKYRETHGVDLHSSDGIGINDGVKLIDQAALFVGALQVQG